MGLLDTIIGTDGGLLDTPVAAPSNVRRAKFGDRLNNLLQSDATTGLIAGLLSGSDTWDSVARGYVGYQGGKSETKKKQDEQTKIDNMNAWLQTKGGDLSPADRAMLMSDPELGRNYAASVLRPKEYEKPPTTANITEFNFAKQNGFTGSFQDWLAQGGSGGGAAEYGLQPIWGKDASGNDVVVQLSKTGQAQQTQLPQGFTPSPGVQKVDLGTAWGIVDRAGNVTSTIPKDVAGEAAATTQGKAQGEAAAAIPAARQTAAMVSQQVEDLKNDDALARNVGPIDSMVPTIFASGHRFQARLAQLQGGAFLQARQLLKGGGAITDYEGAKAEAAFARLNTAQSEDDFKKALDDFNQAVQDGVAKLEAQAGGQVMQPQAPQQPTQQPGQIQIMKPITMPNGVTIEQVK